jgi:hypothetical protein
MMSRDRNFRPAMTNGWLADDIASNLRNNAGLSRSEGTHPSIVAILSPPGSTGLSGRSF